MISTGCDNCKYLKGHRCTLWEVKVSKPEDSHCESWQHIKSNTPDLSTWQGVAKAQ